MDIISRVAVVRAVEGRDYIGKPARVVIATRAYDTDARDLWDAITNPERLPRWFAPVEGDLRLGGRYQVKGNAGGEITRCEPPRRLDLTWEYGGDVSWVNVTLEPKARDRTLLTLEHIAHVEVKPEFWDQFGPGAVGVGWDLGLHGLALYIETGRAMEGSEEEWATSAEGKTFVTLSSEAWCKASIAYGTPAAAAEVAAARTTAFYTGAAPPETKTD